MHQGLPVTVLEKSVSLSSSESKFGTSVNSAALAWTLEEISPSGSWISLYVPSVNGVISIWNVIFEND